MKPNLARDLQHTKKHLRNSLRKEERNGDFYMAAVVQDSLIYSLHHYADSEYLPYIANQATQLTIEAAEGKLGLNEFTVTESIRGVLHAMTGIGAVPEAIADDVLEGACEVIAEISPGDSLSYSDAIANGMLGALSDLGLDADAYRNMRMVI